MLKSHIKSLIPYKAGKQVESFSKFIKLNTNENCYGLDTNTKNFIKKYNWDYLKYYPSLDGIKIREKLANILNVSPSNITLGNGSDELISAIFRTYVELKDELLLTQFTYGAYQCYADQYNISYKILPMKDLSVIDLSLIKNFDVKVVFLTNPNAPTGCYIEIEEIKKVILENKNKLFIIDEAYIEFSESKSCCDLIDKYSNLIILRTFSKSFPFAGGRLGYMISHSKNINAINKVMDPYNVNRFTQLVSEKMLENFDFYKNNLSKVIKIRNWFQKEINLLGFDFFSSKANFVLIQKSKTLNKEKKFKIKELYLFLEKHNILVRFFSSVSLKNYIRISIGKKKEMKALLLKIKEFLEKN